MAKIAFFVYPNISSQIASMKLAADLKAKGHTICYLGIEDSEDYISSHGFEFIPVFQKHFPRGYLAEHKYFDTLPIGIKYFRALRKIATRFKLFLNDLISSGGEEFLYLLKSLQPDLMIFASGSPYIEWIAILAYSLGIKGVYFHDMLTPCEEVGFPPPTSNLIPAKSLWTRIQVYSPVPYVGH